MIVELVQERVAPIGQFELVTLVLVRVSIVKRNEDRRWFSEFLVQVGDQRVSSQANDHFAFIAHPMNHQLLMTVIQMVYLEQKINNIF